MLEATADSLHRAHKAGVVFAMGTDTGFAVTPYGEWHARELALLMDYAGLSPMEAIIAGTRNAAKTLRLEGQIGELTVDAYADVVIWAQDPLKDIRVLQDRKNIVAVIKGGARVDLDADETVRWHHDRAQIYSTEDLTYDVVHGDGREFANMSGRVIELEHDDPESVPIAQAEIPWEPGDGREVVREFKPRGPQETSDPDYPE
jgi:hypothetical protein